MRGSSQEKPESPARRRWRIGSISHATVVAYLALFMAMSGTAVAATGGTFILGRSNSADRVSTVTNSTGPALSLRSPSGQPPLQVNRKVRITNLNADLLDGRDSTGFARIGTTTTGGRTTLSNPDGVPLRLTAKAGSAPLQVSNNVRVTNLNADLLDGRDSTYFVPKSTFDALQKEHDGLYDAHVRLSKRIGDLEWLLDSVSRVDVDGHPTLMFTDVNVQIVNGRGETELINGRGNLIIGYNDQRTPAASRTGSHYLVIGNGHEWSSAGGIVAGWNNTASGGAASVLGGWNNTASGTAASVPGGMYNTASGYTSVVVGGEWNAATGLAASVGGGAYNRASGIQSTVAGGSEKEVSTQRACHPVCD